MELAVRSAPFAGLPLVRLRPSHVVAWVSSMHADGLAESTIRLRVANVRSVLRSAKRDRYMHNDPCDGVQLPRLRKREATMVLPTGAQGRAVMEAAGPQFGAYVACCAFAGLRLGEAAGLQVGDVDWMHRKIAVRRQSQRIGSGQVAIRPPKYGSARDIPVPDGLLALLSEHVRTYCPGEDSKRALFGGLRSNGALLDDNSAGWLWRKACKEAGVEAVRMHDLRHYFASGLISAGCDVVTVSRALGHQSASVTLGVYSHLWPNADDRTRNAAAAMFEAMQESPPMVVPSASCAPDVPRRKRASP